MMLPKTRLVEVSSSMSYFARMGVEQHGCLSLRDGSYLQQCSG